MTDLKNDPERIWSRRYIKECFRADLHRDVWLRIARYKEVKLVINMEINRQEQVKRRINK